MSIDYFGLKKREDWLLSRKGKITSSCCSKILQYGKRDMTIEELDARPKGPRGGLLDKRTTLPHGFSDGAKTYLISKVCEMTSNEIEREINGGAAVKSLEWGVAHEEEAKIEFETVTGLEVLYHGILCPIFYQYGDFAGGSPDGDILMENAGLELKCPLDEGVHMARLIIKSQEQFKKEQWEEFCQCQMNMRIRNCDWWYFGSYDPRKKDKRMRLKIIKLYPDIEWQQEFDKRLIEAVEYMAEILYDCDKYLFID